MRICSLGSGSDGNAVWISAHGVNLLIDAGLTARQIVERLNAIGERPEQLEAIILTHEHTDHIRGLKVLRKQFPRLPLYHSNLAPIESLPFQPTIHFRVGERFTIGKIEIEPFSLPHDAIDPCGFTIISNGERFTYATDLGSVTAELMMRLAESHGALIEANYEPVMLDNNPRYPQFVKDRVKSAIGHLANEDALMLVSGPACPEALCLIGHVSQENNSYRYVQAILKDALSQPAKVHVCRQVEPSPVFEL